MITWNEFLHEVVEPTDDLRAMTFYHGTGEEAGESILKSRTIKPGAVTQGRKQLAPVAGKVYMTPHLHYAQMYAIGGDMAGSETWKPKHRYGYVFGIAGHDLSHIQPDEDSVGEMAAKGKTSPFGTIHRRLHDLSGWVNSEKRRQKMDWGYYADWAAGGKKILKHMGPGEKIEAIRAGAHVAHHGDVPITSAWRIDMNKLPLLKRDGSNFFDHAEKVL